MQSPVRRSGSEMLVFSELHSDDAYDDYDDGVKKTAEIHYNIKNI